MTESSEIKERERDSLNKKEKKKKWKCRNPYSSTFSANVQDFFLTTLCRVYRARQIKVTNLSKKKEEMNGVL